MLPIAQSHEWVFWHAPPRQKILIPASAEGASEENLAILVENLSKKTWKYKENAPPAAPHQIN